MKGLLQERGITCTKPIHANFLTTDPSDYPDVTHLMLDPSCSTSGNSTHPHDSAEDVKVLAQNQLAVVTRVRVMPLDGGGW